MRWFGDGIVKIGEGESPCHSKGGFRAGKNVCPPNGHSQAFEDLREVVAHEAGPRVAAVDGAGADGVEGEDLQAGAVLDLLADAGGGGVVDEDRAGGQGRRRYLHRVVLAPIRSWPMPRS